MVHVSDEVLNAIRANGDVPARSYAHVDRCVRCRKALGAALPPRPPGDRGKRVLLGAACLIAIVLATVAIAPLRAAAFGFVEIFEPHQLAFVPMTAEELRGADALPNFSDFGTSMELRRSQSVQARDLRTAQSAAGYRLLEPQSIDDRADVAYTITTPALEQFTFSEAKAKASALENNRPWQPMPAGMDGSVVRVALGSIVVARYGAHAGGNPASQPRTHGVVFFGGRRTSAAATPARTSEQPLFGQVIVVQMPVPQVGSTGISMREIEAYMIDRPGVPARLSAAFAALRDPTTTLPLPIPIDQRFARPVVVNGVWGTAIGDDTGLGGVVVWERDGFVYGVGGTGTTQSLIATANTLR